MKFQNFKTKFLTLVNVLNTALLILSRFLCMQFVFHSKIFALTFYSPAGNSNLLFMLVGIGKTSYLLKFIFSLIKEQTLTVKLNIFCHEPTPGYLFNLVWHLVRIGNAFCLNNLIFSRIKEQTQAVKLNILCNEHIPVCSILIDLKLSSHISIHEKTRFVHSTSHSLDYRSDYLTYSGLRVNVLTASSNYWILLVIELILVFICVVAITPSHLGQLPGCVEPTPLILTILMSLTCTINVPGYVYKLNELHCLPPFLGFWCSIDWVFKCHLICVILEYLIHLRILIVSL